MLKDLRTDTTVLEARGVTKTYRRGVWPRRRSVAVLRGAEIVMYPGEVVGLVGENGAGKSTLMKIIVGALRRDGGSIQLSGMVGYCPQEPILYARLTCDEHFALFGRGYGMTATDVDVASSAIYDALGFGQWADARVEELSGGTRAKLNLGLALLPDPDLLLLDEPYAGFDYETYLRFWEMSSEIASRGRSILIVSHFVEDQERFDRIYRVADGRCTRER